MTPATEIVPMILPTVMIPLTMVSVGLSVVASFIAALFGIQLKLEGPRKLLEVLLKPKVLGSALLLNVIILGGIWGWKWWNNYPRLLSTIEGQSQKRAETSNLTYQNVPTVQTNFTSSSLKTSSLNVEQIWRIHTGKGSFRSAVITNNRIFTGNDLGIIRELALDTGKTLRTFYVGTAVSSELTIWNNSIYAGEGLHDTHHARIYRFDLGTGKFVGSYQTLGHTEAQAVLGIFEGENTLLAVGGADGLHAIDPISMAGKWKVNIGHMDAGILVENGRVFIGTGREKNDDKKNKCFAAALDFKNGNILWQHELPASSWMRPVSVGADVCYVAGEIYFPTERGHIVCFDKKSGEHTASMNTTDPLAGTPKVLDSSMIVTSIHGQICRFDVKERNKRWCIDTKMKDFSLAGVSYDARLNVLLYPTMKDGLHILDPETGKILNTWLPTKEEGEWKKTYADVAVDGDYWIVSDDDGSVRALKVMAQN